MTISVNPAAVADSISALDISGVTFATLDNIPDSANKLCPLIVPDTQKGLFTEVQSVDRSFGSMGTQAQDFSYNLNYVFLYTEVGSGMSAFAPYSLLIAKLISIINVILNNDVVTDAVDIRLASITDIGAISDPAGNRYWGAFFSLKCLEFGQ